MTRFQVKNEHQEDICYNEIGLCGPHTSTVVDLIINTIERAYVTASTKRQSSILPLITFSSKNIVAFATFNNK